MNKDEVYSQIKNLGFNPKIIVDCGAGWGEWTGLARRHFPESLIVAVDANPWVQGLIPNSDITEIETLSNQNNKEMIFYQKKDKIESGTFCTGDSLFRENTQHYRNHNTLEKIVKTKTLEFLIQKHNINKIDLLKIDTQGSEILIMEGLGDYLNYVEFLELECSIIEYNIGGCNLIDILNFLNKTFDIYDILELHRHNNYLSQIDIIFKNRNSKIQKMML